MIEWVPIKDWEFEKFQLCIIAYNRKTMAGFFALICKESDLQEYSTSDWRVTHIAAVNPPPVEKTLEERFKEKLEKANLPLTRDLYEDLAQIAKEHYEGEK